MRVLIDESLPRDLAGELTGHEVQTVAQMKWAGIKNGELLRRAVAEGFAVLVTGDQNLEYQQNIPKSGIGLVVLAGKSTRLVHVKPLVPSVLLALAKVAPGTVVRVAA